MTNTTLKMTAEETRTYLREQIEDYLNNEMGINTRGNFKCVAGTHDDNNPSMSLDRKNLQAHCFQCGAKFDIFDLVGIHENISDFKDQLEYLCDIYNVDIIHRKARTTAQKVTNPKKEKISTASTVHTVQTVQTACNKDYSELYRKWHADLNKCNYLTERGISPEIQKKYNIGYAPDFKVTGNATWQALIIPTSKSTFVARNIAPTDKNDRYKKIGGSSLFNLKKKLFEDNTPIFITEGEIDALSFLEVGAKAIGIGTTANVKKLADKLKNSEYLKTLDADRKPALIICLDNDKAGTEATTQLTELFKGTDWTLINACEGDIDNGTGNPIYATYKDANEILVKNRALFIEQVRLYEELATTKRTEKLENYKKEMTAYASLAGFWNGIKAGASTTFIPTGYSELDKTLDGGITEGLYIIGAISSLGKTTFTLQMADQIAKYGTDVLIFSLEMAKTELMAKSLSRITYMFGDVDMAKTTRGITTSAKYEKYSNEEVKTIENAVREYSTYAKNIYIKEGMGDVTIQTITNAVADHVEITKNKPVVIIDYVQLIAPDNDRLSDKQIIDRAVLGLKRLSRDFKIPVIAISSFNRQSYKEVVSMASFKESGAIEYGTDVLIGLQLEGAGTSNFDEMKQKSISNDVRTPRRIELKILKNRNGRTGDTLKYRFYSAFNFFEEEASNYMPLEVTTGNVEELSNTDEFDMSDIEDEYAY